jgi:hypothetical protein
MTPRIRTFLIGLAVAASAGLLMGAALKPDLGGEHAGRAPQILIPFGGPRIEQAAVERGIAAYGGEIPTWVLGTDSLPPPEPQVTVAAYDDPEPAEPAPSLYEAAAPQPPPDGWTEPPRRAPRYPSIDGGVAYGAEIAPAG